MAKKLLCLLLVLTLALSASMVSFADCGVWEYGNYKFAYCATPICAGMNIPTAYGHQVHIMYCNGATYTRDVVVARGCCN